MSGRDITTCWWCNERPASTREHRIKRSRLEDEKSSSISSDPLTLYSVNHQYSTLLKSSRSRSIQFGKTMCATCNGGRSQPFDNAYEHFVKWAFDNKEAIRSSNEVKWDDVFHGTSLSQRELVCYYIKNTCCRMVDRGFSVPAELIAYLDGRARHGSFSAVFYRYFGLDDALKLNNLPDDKSPRAAEGNTEISIEGEEPNVFCALVEDGFFGVLIFYAKPKWQTSVPKNLGEERVSKIYDVLNDFTEFETMFEYKYKIEHILRIQHSLGRKLQLDELDGVLLEFNQMRASGIALELGYSEWLNKTL